MYRLTTDERSQPQIEALPGEALASFAEARVMLEIAPWAGDPLDDNAPDAPCARSLSGRSSRVCSPTWSWSGSGESTYLTCSG